MKKVALLALGVMGARACSPLSCSTMQSIVASHFSSSVQNDMLCIAFHESSYEPCAYNPSGASGLFQIEPLWLGHGNCPSNAKDLFDAEANAACATTVLAQQGLTAWQTWDEGDCTSWSRCTMGSEDVPSRAPSLAEAKLWNSRKHAPAPDQYVPTKVSGCASAPLYSQCNSAWGSNHLGTSSQTICQAGCAMSSVAMYLSQQGHKYTPGTLNTWLTNNGGYAGGDEIEWGAVSALGISFQSLTGSTTSEAIQSAIGRCAGVIANVRSGTHWVLVTGYAGNNNFYVNDPGFDESTYAFSQMSYWAFYSP